MVPEWLPRATCTGHAGINACMTLHYFIGSFRIETADSAQPRKHSMVTRLFSSSVRVGPGLANNYLLPTLSNILLTALLYFTGCKLQNLPQKKKKSQINVYTSSIITRPASPYEEDLVDWEKLWSYRASKYFTIWRIESSPDPEVPCVCVRCMYM